MRLRLIPALLLALLAVAAVAVTACGSSDDEPVLEGQPLELGDLTYAVELTRFLNPASEEDAAYLTGQPDAPLQDDYLAVFLRVDNDSDSAQQLADEFKVVDTRGNEYEPVPSDSDFALQPGAEIPAGEDYPPLDSPARSGPVKGSFLLFKLPVAAQEDRPLNLEITGPDGQTGEIELDL